MTIFGQEKYPDTAGLAKMNFVLHNKGTGEIKSGNTLADPQYLDEFGELKKFDFIVMNPPFSDKDWTDGITTTKDKFRRFDGFGIPPEKNGDYAWFLHVLKALDSNGKAGIILPHGVLFRGNAEESIRIEVLKKNTSRESSAFRVTCFMALAFRPALSSSTRRMQMNGMVFS